MKYYLWRSCLNFPTAACEKYPERWSWYTQRLVTNCHLENSIVWQMTEASLKTGGGERTRAAMGVSCIYWQQSKCSCAPWTRYRLAKRHTWKSSVSPRWFQQSIWWDGSLESSFKLSGHYLQQRSTSRTTQKSSLQENCKHLDTYPNWNNYLTANRNFKAPQMHTTFFPPLPVSSFFYSPQPQKS